MLRQQLRATFRSRRNELFVYVKADSALHQLYKRLERTLAPDIWIALAENLASPVPLFIPQVIGNPGISTTERNRRLQKFCRWWRLATDLITPATKSTLPAQDHLSVRISGPVHTTHLLALLHAWMEAADRELLSFPFLPLIKQLSLDSMPDKASPMDLLSWLSRQLGAFNRSTLEKMSMQSTAILEQGATYASLQIDYSASVTYHPWQTTPQMEAASTHPANQWRVWC
ncbi:hypothetical protein [Aquitalea sp.]|uniref:hypothetical protein n=1 Tax=Aquitalea sp. TaxID=1872623 RepID=UPI002587D952|nr:hypothetical protein [Aquitalea sp.]